MSSTGRSIVSTCAARAALAGNPSDGYGGAVVAIPIPDLTAIATIDESDRPLHIETHDNELRHLAEATIDAALERFPDLPPGELAVSTGIPRSVGLAGSSAIVIAILRAVGAWEGRRWDALDLAELALSVERDRLGIEAGLQDRLVQAVGKPVSMSFDRVAFDVLDIDPSWSFFVAWDVDAAETSDTTHRSIRRRFEADDPDVVAAMGELKVQAGRARRAIIDADKRLLADAMHRTLAVRLQLAEPTARQRRLIELGRSVGAALNSAGSGGSVVGLARNPAQLDRARVAYRSEGLAFLELT